MTDERVGAREGELLWYVRLRWTLIVGALVLGVAARVLGPSFPIMPFLIVLAAAAVRNAWFPLCRRGRLPCLPCPLRRHSARS